MPEFTAFLVCLSVCVPSRGRIAVYKNLHTRYRSELGDIDSDSEADSADEAPAKETKTQKANGACYKRDIVVFPVNCYESIPLRRRANTLASLTE